MAKNCVLRPNNNPCMIQKNRGKIYSQKLLLAPKMSRNPVFTKENSNRGLNYNVTITNKRYRYKNELIESKIEVISAHRYLYLVPTSSRSRQSPAIVYTIDDM